MTVEKFPQEQKLSEKQIDSAEANEQFVSEYSGQGGKDSVGWSLRYKADRRTLLFVASHLILNAYLWSCGWQRLLREPLLMAQYVLLLGFSFSTVCIIHNSIHCPVFKSTKLNRMFRVALTIAYGHPVSSFVPGHNLSHHVYTQSQKDYMRTSKVRYRWNLLNLLLFYFHVVGGALSLDIKYMKQQRQLKRPTYYTAIWEYSCLFAVLAPLLVWDWQRFLIFWQIPRFVCSYMIVTVNMLQHDGCEEDDNDGRPMFMIENPNMNTARSFVGHLINWWTFNNGYHMMHHLKPSLHWSLLPQTHEKTVHPNCHPALEQDNIALYIWRAFVYPGERVMYDGRSINFRPVDEDFDIPWIK